MSGQMKSKSGRDAARAAQNPVAKRAAEQWIERGRLEDQDIDNVVGYLRKPPGQDWTAEDEAEIQRQWDVSEMKQVKDDAKWGNYAQFANLLRISLRVLGVALPLVISPLCAMRFLPEASARGWASKYIYARPFCDALSSIIVHPFVGTGVQRLVAVLSYAIVCRTDNREVGLFADQGLNDCPAFMRAIRWLESSREQGPDQSRHLTLGQSLDRSAEKRESVSAVTKLFHHIGSIASSKEYNIATPSQGFDVEHGLPVVFLTSEDVNNVREAIDTFDWPETLRDKYACTTAEALQSYRLTHKVHDKPGASELGQYFERCHKEVMRGCLLEARRRTEPAPSPQDDEHEEYHRGENNDGDIQSDDGHRDDESNNGAFQQDATPPGAQNATEESRHQVEHLAADLPQSEGNVLQTPSSSSRPATMPDGYPIAAELHSLVQKVLEMETMQQEQEAKLQEQDLMLRDYAAEVEQLRRDKQQLSESLDTLLARTGDARAEPPSISHDDHGNDKSGDPMDLGSQHGMALE
ncbi:hypothetical protein FPSE_11099 [Fusarium pseudograminearum CS3096]|uniref:Uncharacterized protein n=2 Tax=Fusarium pseudograminearum TaxID=101028 RepID=K3UBE8_FUSPC|nr:hypothetical protein FPSE_11099 [Fusarium pseudograminearum CS3096]EKJ68721.1 hypothetical protein FPSE_11099 [Fusarium pseudograminearum CS3096]CEG02892.1 unnamed protein product [Fusarium pseudograminearum CS3487]